VNKVLESKFYSRSTVDVARELVGMRLVRNIMTMAGDFTRIAGIIVETEAYEGTDDPASHARMGPTSRNHVMFGPAGRSYVYFTYGNHFCFNVTAKSRSQLAGAVLLRAIEPLEGTEIMKANRGREDLRMLASGPGRLAQALGIDRKLNGVDMTLPGAEICIEANAAPKRVAATPRIGITRATRRRWRFVDASSRFQSRYSRIKVR